MRLATDFRLSVLLKVLFCAIVRPVLEHGCVILDPHIGAGHSRSLESVQRKFLLFASYVLNIPCPPHDYAPVADTFGLSSLTERVQSSNF